MKSVPLSLACLATSLALVAGCATTHDASMASTPAAAPMASSSMPAKSTSAFPTGRFQNGDMIAVMNPDGTYVGTTPTNDDWVKGNYTVDGDMVAINDSWMAEKYKEGSCVGKGAGRYRWAATAAGISYTLVDDPCEARAKGLGDNGAWTRVP